MRSYRTELNDCAGMELYYTITQSCFEIRTKNMNFIAAITLLSSWYCWLINFKAQAILWNRFITSIYYSDLKLVSELNSFIPRFFPQEIPLGHLRMECSKYCAANESCYAFNLYQSGSFYACELVPDNFCVDRTHKALLDSPGNEIWDKLSTGLNKSCLEIRYPSPASISCAVFKPGCLGTWPNCNTCPRSCKDCYNMTTINGFYDCSFWPDGPSGTPIFGKCFAGKTFLIRRVVNLATAKNDVMYRMSFYDMKRMQLIQDLTVLEFHFFTSDYVHHWVQYKDFNLDINGTLHSLTFYNATPQFDMFSSESRAPGPIPFVIVSDDRFGCGSFWLLDPSNATYCPGGGVRMLGPLQLNGNQVTKTGIRYPTISASSFITSGSLELY